MMTFKADKNKDLMANHNQMHIFWFLTYSQLEAYQPESMLT